MPDIQLMLDFESKPEQLLSTDEIFEKADEDLVAIRKDSSGNWRVQVVWR